MKITNYTFNGITIPNLDAEIRTILVNPITKKMDVEVDIKAGENAAISRENISFAIEDDSIISAITALVFANFDLETGKQILREDA